MWFDVLPKLPPQQGQAVATGGGNIISMDRNWLIMWLDVIWYCAAGQFLNAPKNLPHRKIYIFQYKMIHSLPSPRRSFVASANGQPSTLTTHLQQPMWCRGNLWDIELMKCWIISPAIFDSYYITYEATINFSTFLCGVWYIFSGLNFQKPRFFSGNFSSLISREWNLRWKE